MTREKINPYCNNYHNLKKNIIIIRSQIQKRNSKGLFKINTFLPYIVWFIPALFYVGLLRLLRPWIIIRIRQIYSKRIGHFAANTEVYLCEKDMGINIPNQRFLDIWYYDGPVCNLQLQKMWNRVLKIWPFHLSSLIVKINYLLPDGELYTIPWRNSDRDFYNVLELFPPHLSFTQDEEEYGRIMLESMGVSSHSLFICFAARDPAYIELIYPDENDNWHDYRYRNTDVKNYLLATEEMVNRGYYAIRMGAVVKEALVSNNPKIIDYATNGKRSDFMDIYLGAKCHFFISSGTGIDTIPDIFRRPILYVNLVPLEYAHTWNKNHIFIPKLYWLEKEQKFMSFRDIIKSGAGLFQFAHQFVDKGITLIENTPDEIREVTIEMEERLKGIWVTTEEDEDLQRRFWSLFESSKVHGKIYSRIGAAFLRKYQTLLE